MEATRKKKTHKREIMDGKKMKKQSFIVDVIEHQKGTWQGQIHWIQGDKKISFRSVLEMLYLMDSVVSDGDEEEALPEAGR